MTRVYFPPIPAAERCDCGWSEWPIRPEHRPWQHAWTWRWVVGGAIPTGPSMRYGYSTDRAFEEHWVVAQVIEALLQYGYDATHMVLERTIERGSRPDLTIEPPSGPIELWEAKRGRPITKDREQVARYVEVGRRVWPDRDVRVMLVYPTERGGETLRVEAIA